MQLNQVISGTISVHPRGFGFVAPLEKGLEDLFIPGSKLSGAMDGDLVIAKVLRQSSKGFEGEIVKIEKRKRSQLVGTVVNLAKNGDALVFAPILGEDREVVLKKDKETPLKIGDRVSLDIISEEGDTLKCKLHKFLGSIDDATLDTQIAILEHGIQSAFSQEALKEADSFPKTLPKIKGRRDLTHLHTVTIDPVNARDYDDALSIEKDEKGNYHLGVHIADVSHFVKVDSFLDKEACLRSNSTYFIDQVVPMLPENLSNNLCSLRENEDRYVLSVLMTLNPKGILTSYEIVKGIICSRKRFTYQEAFELINNKKKSPHRETLSLLVELCAHFKAERKKRCSVDLALPEVRLIMGEDGVPIGQERLEYDITHQMVEEFMLKANEMVATHLLNQGKKSIFRIHEEPSPENLEEFFTHARLLGFRLSGEPAEGDIRALFEMAQNSPHLEQLAVRYIRSMKLAIYSKENIGHYGLALENYTHFTSPIRRYSDLVIHRLLFDDNYKPDLDMVATLCSQKERVSFKAEMSVLKLKKLRYLDRITDKDPSKTFAATVTNIKPIGIYFDIDFIGFEGFIHVSELGNDYYVYNEKGRVFRGEKSGALFHSGLKIEVRLETIDLVYQECTWALQKGEGKSMKGEGKTQKER